MKNSDAAVPRSFLPSFFLSFLSLTLSLSYASSAGPPLSTPSINLRHLLPSCLFPPLLLHIWILDSQAPNIQIITNGRDDIVDETSINPNPQSYSQKHKADLIDSTAQRARPQSDGRTDAVDDGQCEWEREDVVHGEFWVFDQVGCYDGADRVGVYEADVECKGDQMVEKNDRLEVEVDGDEEPGRRVREEAYEGWGGGFGGFVRLDVKDAVGITYQIGSFDW